MTPAPQPHDQPQPNLRDAARGIRLQKAMAQAGVASRRDCEALIEQGRVRVNGHTVRELPAWVDPAHDQIIVDEQPLARPRQSKRRTGRFNYIMLNKPRGVISTTDDPDDRPTVTNLLDMPPDAVLFPVGRLDAESTGLILLTDDGELAQRLTHPRYEVPKIYEVLVRGRIGQDDLQKLRDGLFLIPKNRPGIHTKKPNAPARAKKAAVGKVAILRYERDRVRGDRTRLTMTLTEGQNREIRRLLARLGYKVQRLKRVAIGPLRLKGLAEAQWRRLTAAEIRSLQKLLNTPDKT